MTPGPVNLEGPILQQAPFCGRACWPYLDSNSSSIPEAPVHLAKAPLTQQGPQLHILKGLIPPCLNPLLHPVSTPAQHAPLISCRSALGDSWGSIRRVLGGD